MAIIVENVMTFGLVLLVAMRPENDSLMRVLVSDELLVEFV